MARKNRPHTLDGRYLVSKGILKRCTNPALDDGVRRGALKALMQARMTKDKEAALKAKTILGEAGLYGGKMTLRITAICHHLKRLMHNGGIRSAKKSVVPAPRVIRWAAHPTTSKHSRHSG